MYMIRLNTTTKHTEMLKATVLHTQFHGESNKSFEKYDGFSKRANIS